MAWTPTRRTVLECAAVSLLPAIDDAPLDRQWQRVTSSRQSPSADGGAPAAAGSSDVRDVHDVKTFMITGNVPVEYRLTVDGTLRPDTEGGEFMGEESDAPTQNSDGTWTASDGTGPHPTNVDGITYYGDRFFFSGSITELYVSPDRATYDVNVYIDERQVSVAEAADFVEYTGTHTFMLTANGPTQYSITVDGSLEPDTEGGEFIGEEDTDMPTQNSDGTWTASDGTGPHPTNADGMTYYGDRYFFTGDVVDLGLSLPDGPGDVNLYLDERQIEREDLVSTGS